MSPHTHEASRKLGLTHFGFRDCGDGKKDSKWCTTYKSPLHFNSYYYKHGVTFYYIKVKSEQMIEKLKKSFPDRWENLIVFALVVLDDNKIDGYDGLDRQINNEDIKTLISIMKLNDGILISRRSTEKRKLTFNATHQKNIQKYIKNGSKGDLEFDSVDTLGDLTSVDGNLLLSNINSLGNLTFVNGNLEINRSPNLKNLGNLTSVKGNLTLRYVELNFKENPNCFGNLKYIGGNLDLGNMAMSSLMVTGKLSPMAFETEIRKIIEIKGKVIN
jgi:hypothetical protein